MGWEEYQDSNGDFVIPNCDDNEWWDKPKKNSYDIHNDYIDSEMSRIESNRIKQIKQKEQKEFEDMHWKDTTDYSYKFKNK